MGRLELWRMGSLLRPDDRMRTFFACLIALVPPAAIAGAGSLFRSLAWHFPPIVAERRFPIEKGKGASAVGRLDLEVLTGPRHSAGAVPFGVSRVGKIRLSDFPFLALHGDFIAQRAGGTKGETRRFPMNEVYRQKGSHVDHS